MGRIKSVVGGAGDFKGNYDGISMVQVPATRQYLPRVPRCSGGKVGRA